MPLFGGKSSKADDPFYNRKPVPDEFSQDVGLTGLTRQEEFVGRERKLSVDGVDLRKFGTKKSSGWKPQSDPFYGRKPVSKEELEGVGETGLTEEEEFENRERKYSLNGVDLRKFSMTATSGFKPQADPYYGRKMVDSVHTKGIGDTYNTPAEDYAVRERKQSILQLNSDPFQVLTGSGHRQSVSTASAVGTANAATERRRSSAIAPDAARAAANTAGHQHSGYDGDKLEPIVSRADGESSTTGVSKGESSTVNGASHGQSHFQAQGGQGHTMFHDATTSGHNHGSHGLVNDDDVAPDQRV